MSLEIPAASYAGNWVPPTSFRCSFPHAIGAQPSKMLEVIHFCLLILQSTSDHGWRDKTDLVMARPSEPSNGTALRVAVNWWRPENPPA